ncbi:hypothetical protein CCACVL1_15956 [Corchorus capsularis]|uniref:Uncharacterized protein n=1 Tax=Corchorus capsularis TaxID=210143 RepID=A0A1R3I0I2_COCAP|nr:hypothetical protein CCACVL1_15956 [Corchorus capsularis]
MAGYLGPHVTAITQFESESYS